MISRNAPEELIHYINEILGVKIVQANSRYLGHPLILNRKRCDSFQTLLDKIWSKTQSWKAKTLSIGGRQVLFNKEERDPLDYANTLRKEKEDGGLGFINFKWVNLGFLAK
ncbi:hypothetical protein QQ045_023743 [Rhodiola kirilowii]